MTLQSIQTVNMLPIENEAYVNDYANSENILELLLFNCVEKRKNI